MGTWIDLSDYQHNAPIDWAKVANDPQRIEGIIRRTTRKDGTPDRYLYDDIKNARQVWGLDVDFYKFMYSHTFTSAYNEMCEAIKSVYDYLIPNTYFYIDIETHDGGRYTETTAREVIAGALIACMKYEVVPAVYCNWDYFTRIIPEEFKGEYGLEFWLARYTDDETFLDSIDANVIMWQYSSRGKVNGISGDVDMNILF